jgi:hypothetical protein
LWKIPAQRKDSVAPDAALANIFESACPTLHDPVELTFIRNLRTIWERRELVLSEPGRRQFSLQDIEAQIQDCVIDILESRGAINAVWQLQGDAAQSFLDTIFHVRSVWLFLVNAITKCGCTGPGTGVPSNC